jgi:hypothetical protein
LTSVAGSISSIEPDMQATMDHLHYRLNFDLDKNFITA